MSDKSIIPEYDIDDIYDNNENSYNNTSSVYEINPSIQITRVTQIQRYESSIKWHIVGFIDMDYRFFEHSRGYQFYMNDKSFDIQIIISNDYAVEELSHTFKHLNDLLSISRVKLPIPI